LNWFRGKTNDGVLLGVKGAIELIARIRWREMSNPRKTN